MEETKTNPIGNKKYSNKDLVAEKKLLPNLRQTLTAVTVFTKSTP